MDTLSKEDLSVAYLQAVCAKSGVTINILHRDEDGADVSLKKPVERDDSIVVRVTVEAQLKSTSSLHFYQEDDNQIVYKAKQKCYNDLVEVRVTPLYLFLLILPEEDDECVTFNIDSLVLKRCMYWTKLEPGTMKTDQSFKEIVFDKKNTLSPEALNKIIKMEANSL